MAQDANFFQNFKIGTCLHERLTNAFSQKREHSLNGKISILGSFQGIFLFIQILNCSCIINNFMKVRIIKFVNCIL